MKKLVSLTRFRDYRVSGVYDCGAASLVRAKFLEKIAENADKDKKDEYFTLKIFSILDVLLQVPISEELDGLYLNISIKRVLMGDDRETLMAKIFF